MCKLIYMIYDINKIQTKNHMIAWIGTETTFDKIQHHFIIKTHSKLGIEETYLYIIEAICDKPMTNILWNGENWRSSKSCNKIRRITFTTLFKQHKKSYSNQANNRNKRLLYWKRESKFFPHTRIYTYTYIHRHTYIHTYLKTSQIILKLTNKFSTLITNRLRNKSKKQFHLQ